MSKKILVLFDFDHTITDNACFEEIYKLITEPKLKEEMKDITAKGKLRDLNLFILKCIKLFKLTQNDVRKKVSVASLTEGMEKLLEYLKNNKNVFTPFILTSNIDIIIKNYLQDHRLDDIFIDVVGYRGEINKEKDEMKMMDVDYEQNCDLCGYGLCKGNEYRKLLEERKEKYDKIVFIADGKNDFCLARLLGKEDILFPRIGYRLLQKIEEKEFKEQIKCEVYPWKNGMEIIEKLNSFK